MCTDQRHDPCCHLHTLGTKLQYLQHKAGVEDCPGYLWTIDTISIPIDTVEQRWKGSPEEHPMAMASGEQQSLQEAPEVQALARNLALEAIYKNI